jgi:hypothetical protein
MGKLSARVAVVAGGVQAMMLVDHWAGHHHRWGADGGAATAVMFYEGVHYTIKEN